MLRGTCAKFRGQQFPPLGRISPTSSWAQGFLWALTEHVPSLAPSLLENVAHLSVVALEADYAGQAQVFYFSFLLFFFFFVIFILYGSIVD